MRIVDLKLINFRNYKQESIRLDKNINIFVGDNAQGKTNLLESIYTCAKGYSFKAAKESELVLFGEKRAYLRAIVDRNGRYKQIEMKIFDNEKKQIRVNEIPIVNLNDMSTQFGVVLFSPDDLKIIKESPSYRRKFIDSIATEVFPSYKKNLSVYNRIVLQRNNLLKKMKYSKYFSEQLQSLDVALVKAGVRLSIYRQKVVAELSDIAAEYQCRATDGKEKLELKYQSDMNMDVSELKEMEKDFYGRLLQNNGKDIENGFTTLGPHKDDIDIYINDKKAKTYASQGQIRTIMLSMRLGELKILEKYNGTSPILLLDDVFSELDQQRRDFVLRSIEGFQSVITTNHLEDVFLKGIEENKKDICLFHINSGNIEEEGCI